MAAAGAISGIWLVAYYPGWAVTYTILGAVIVFVLTLYERELRSSWPWAPLRAYAAKVFALNTNGVNVPRGVAVAGLVLIALVVTASLHQEQYFLSVAFGVLFVALSDQGGDYLSRLGRMAVVGLIGGLVTALGYGIGGDAWGWAVLATFVVTVLAGLAINIDLYALSPRSFSASGSSSPCPPRLVFPPVSLPTRGSRRWPGSSDQPSGSLSPSFCGWYRAGRRSPRRSPRSRPTLRRSN